MNYPPSNIPASVQTHMPPPDQRTFSPETRARRAAVVVWGFVRRVIFRWTPPPFNFVRLVLLWLFGARVHHSSYVHPTIEIDRPWNLEIGRHVVVAHRVVFNCMGRIYVGDGTRISQFAHLCAVTHDYHARDMHVHTPAVHIGADVWLASDVFIGPGVSIGDRTVVGARSNVFSDLPPDVVAYGSRARPVRPRPPMTSSDNDPTTDH